MAVTATMVSYSSVMAAIPVAASIMVISAASNIYRNTRPRCAVIRAIGRTSVIRRSIMNGCRRISPVWIGRSIIGLRRMSVRAVSLVLVRICGALVISALRISTIIITGLRVIIALVIAAII